MGQGARPDVALVEQWPLVATTLGTLAKTSDELKKLRETSPGSRDGFVNSWAAQKNARQTQ